MDWGWQFAATNRNDARFHVNLNGNMRRDRDKKNDESGDKQLLRLTICQALQSQYVMEHTRGIDRFLSPNIHKTTEEEEEADEESEQEIDCNSLTSLLFIALNESKSRHLTAGFLSNNENVANNLAMIVSRLGRELCAIGLCSDLSYLSLTNKRSIILAKMMCEYEAQYRLKGMALLSKKTLPDTAHSLLKLSINSGVFFMMTMLESASLSNPSLCMQLLSFLQSQLQLMKPMELETNDKLPLPSLAESSFNSVNKTLFTMASNQQCDASIRYKCLELLLQLSVSRATLSILLSVIYLLLFEFNDDETILLEWIVLLRKMKRRMRLDLPNKQNEMLRASISNVCDGTSHCAMATDAAAQYLFIHSNRGLFKIGTGINNTSPGSIVLRKLKYRQSEKSSLVCCGDVLYYRSSNVSKSCEAIVLSTNALKEIGYIKRDGKGTVPTADNSHVLFGVDISDAVYDEDEHNDKTEEDEDTAEKSTLTLRMRLRTIQNRIMQLENAGMDDCDEIEDLEMEYEDLFNALPVHIQDMIEEYDSSIGSLSMQDEEDFNYMISQSNNRTKEKEKHCKIPRYNPLISDGRFVYAVVPEKGTKTDEKDNEEDEGCDSIFIRLNAFDPMDNLSHCNSIVLKRPLPSENTDCVLDFNSTKQDDLHPPNASKYSSKYSAHNSSCIDLGCPSQLNFGGSITMECYFKYANTEMKRVPQQLFYHGDGSYWLYIYIQNSTIYAGCNTPVGSSKVYCTIQSTVNVLQWTHIAATYDTSDAIWRIYVNGHWSNPNARTVNNTRAGPQGSSAPWIIGSVQTKPFYGQICDVRIWSCARTEEEIAACRKVDNVKILNQILNHRELRGYWPCHDAVGLLCTDISKYKHHGFIRDCSWKLGEKRPFKCAYDVNNKTNHEVVNNKKYVLQSFDASTCSKAVFYTNGEILVIAYPSFTFWNKSYRGVAQKFELTNNTGLLTDECEYDYFGKILCATFVNDWKSMWLYSKSSPHASCHTMAAPTTISRWRRQRMTIKQDTKKGNTLTVKHLATKAYYGIKNIDFYEDDDDDGDIKQDDETLPMTNLAALANILIKLDEDTDSLRSVDPNEAIPISLSIPFGVDLNSATFETLLDIAEKLSHEFYAQESNKVRMLCLVIVVRLLRTNIAHLISWNVDPYSVGFNKSIKQRYVALLNQLVFDSPTAVISKLIENDIHRDCSECLSCGLSVFFTNPSDRVRILIEHVDNLLIESASVKDKCNARLLLASRYFNSLTQPHNLIALVPAIKKGEHISLLLSPILQLVYMDCKKELHAYLELKHKPQKHVIKEDALIATLRQFLSRVTVCLFNDNDTNIYPYCFNLIDKCTELLSYSDQHCETQQKTHIVNIFRNKFGELLLPILTCIWSLNLDKQLKLCSDILTKLFALIKTLNHLIVDLPHCVQAEDRFINKEPNKITVQRDVMCESKHPVQRGFTEKHIFIPGAKSLKLTIDKQTFNSQHNSVGCSLTFYKKSGQNDAIVSFTSQPSKPFTIDGDSCYVVFSSGYSNNAWGFKIAVHAKIEEVQFDIPWILDLAKNAAIVSSKCIGAFISAKMDIDQVFKNEFVTKEDKEKSKSILLLPRTEAKWLASDLLSSGRVFDTKDIEYERQYVQEMLADNTRFPMDSTDIAAVDSTTDQMEYTQILSIAEKLFPLLQNVRVMTIPTPKDVAPLVSNCILHVFATLLLHNNLIKLALEVIDNGITEDQTLPESIIRIYKTSKKNFTQWLLQRFQTEYANKQQALQKKKAEYDAKKKEQRKKKKKGKQSKKAVSVVLPMVSNHFEPQPSPQLIGMMPELDTHGLPIQHSNQNGHDQRLQMDDEAKHVMEDMLTSNDDYEEDDDDDDYDSIPDDAEDHNENESMSALLAKKKKMAMGNGTEQNITKKKKSDKSKTQPNLMQQEQQPTIQSAAYTPPIKHSHSFNKKSMKHMTSKWEVNKKDLYGEICKEIEKRCVFLLSVLSVQPETIVPTRLTRNKSTNADTKDNKTAALAAWQHMQSAGFVTLKYATPERRPSLIWKYVLSFLDEKEIDCELMIKRIKLDRIKSRLRAHGLHMLTIFMSDECTTFAMLRRELMHFLVPSLYDMYDAAFSGRQINILNGLTPIGGALTNALNSSLKQLMYLLKELMMKPKQVGSILIKCILFSFSFRYDIKELSMVINDVKIFEVLRTLLNEKHFGLKSIGFKTAAWSLMEMFTTTILQFKNKKEYGQTNHTTLVLFDAFLQNVYHLQIEQLHAMAQTKAHTLSNYVQQHPLKEQEEDTGEHKEKKEENGKEEEAFNVRVLSFMLHSLADNKERELFCGDKSLNALLSLSFESSSPRTRMVSLRLLRKLLLNEKLIQMDKQSFINKMLSNIGQALLSSVISSCFMRGQTDDTQYLSALRLPELYSQDGCWIQSEEIMLIRYLVRMSTSWSIIISDIIYTHLMKLPYALNTTEDTIALNDALFVYFGCLGVFGGYTDTVRVGTKCYYIPENIIAVVTSRHLKKNKISLIREYEESHITNVSITDIICIGDEIFDATKYSLNDTQYTELMRQLRRIITGYTHQTQQTENITRNRIISNRLFALSLSCLSSILLNEPLLNLYLTHFDMSDLMAIAFRHTPQKHALPTSMLNDQSLIISSMLMNRCRAYEDIGIELFHSQKNVGIALKNPNIEFKAEFIKFGLKLESKKQGIAGLSESTKGKLKGLFSYLKLYEKITPQKVNGKIVCLDTYYKRHQLKLKLAECKKKGAIAVVLLLHSKCARDEGLDESNHDEDEDDDDDDPHDSIRTKSTISRDIVDIAGQSALRSIDHNHVAFSGGPAFPGGPSGDLLLFSPHFEQSIFGGNQFQIASNMNMLRAANPMMHAVNMDHEDKEEDDDDDEYKEEHKEEEEDQAIDKIISSLHIMAVDASAANVIHLLSGIKGSEYPHKVYHKKMIDELISKGHAKEMACRALQKNSKMSVDAADRWIAQNKEWLEADIKVKQDIKGNMDQEETEYKSLSKDDILNENNDLMENTWKLAEKWRKFDDSGLRYLNVTTRRDDANGDNDTPSDSRDAPRICDRAWYKSIFYESTYHLLSKSLQLDHALSIHHARRCLLSMFMNANGTVLQGLSRTNLLKVFNICLSLQVNPSHELNPIESYRNPSSVCQRIISLIDDNHSNIYCDLLLSFSSSFLHSMRSIDCHTAAHNKKENATDNKLETIVAAVHGRWEQHNNRHRRGIGFGGISNPQTQQRVQNAQFFQFSGKSDDNQKENTKRKRRLKLIVRSDPTLCNMGTTYVTIYAQKECKNVLAQFSCFAFDNQSNVCTVNGSSFYYTVLSSSFYQGSPPSNVIITVVDITHHFFDSFTEDIVIYGRSISNCLSYIECMLNSQKCSEIQFDLILLQLLQCLEFSSSMQEAQGICRVASAIFNEWSNLTHGDEDDVVLKSISECMVRLERSHEELRTETIKHWSSGSFPGPHVQCLLELLLSAQQSLSLQSTEKEAANEEEGGEKDTSKDDKDLYDEYYTKYRNGSSHLSMISLSRESICPSLTMTVSRDAQNRYLIDDFVADCSVSGGGRWYFEISFVGQCQYCCVGFIDRKYRKTSNTGISNDYEGHAWSIVGPNTQYMHRSRNAQPMLPKDAKNSDKIGIASWSPNCTVGVKLDLFENTIEFIFEGKSTGIAFAGVGIGSSPKELYPAVSLNQNTSCHINLGRKAFKYEVEADGFIGFESPQADNKNSWLHRYAIASHLTYYLSHNLKLPAQIVDTCLVDEVSLENKHDVQFEIVKSNAATTTTGASGEGIDVIFKDNCDLFHSNKPSSTNICLKVSGFEATEFVLTGINVRCSTTSNGFRVFAFISNTNCEPDFDQYNWCSHWNKSQYNEHFGRGRSNKKQINKPHEPIAFESTNSSSVYIKLSRATRGKYLTLKIVANVVHNGLYIEYVKLHCVHGKHPLSECLLLDDEYKLKRRQIISELRRNMLEDTTNSVDNCLLTEMSQMIAQRLSVTPQTLDSAMLEPTEEELKRFKFCANDVRLLQSRFALIKYLNRLVTPLLHYIDITMFHDDDDKKQKKNSKIKSLSAQIHELKGCYFMSTKQSVFDVLLASTASSSCSASAPAAALNSRRRVIPSSPRSTELPRVTLNRIVAAKASSNKQQQQNDGKLSVFGQLFCGLQHLSYGEYFRTAHASAQLWSVTFVGEGSIDVGGPYRESLTYAVRDLHSSATPLFLLCPNGRNSVGLNREKYIPNPSCVSSDHLAQYEFVGVLMGIALRTKQTLAFDLPSFIWKKLLNLSCKIDVSDLSQVDKLCVQALNEIANNKTEDLALFFVASLSNGSVVELCPNGANKRVTTDNRDEFISLLIAARLNESGKQIEHIRRGLNEICASRILSLFTWYDLESMICGDPNISISILRQHTVYQDGLSAASSLIKYFWKTLHSFTQRERQLFLRFVWGRNRLPNPDDFNENFTIKKLNTNNVESLPIAHTCFFSIDLPPFTSFKTCRQKILYAINNCQAIDVDFNPNSSSLQAWIG